MIDLSLYEKAFLEENSKVNLISKNDEKFLIEKHVKDSLAIEKFFEKYGICKRLLDIGTGGGFPSVLIAMKYPEIEVTALDSIRKKINAIDNIKTKLGIKNLITVCDRAENLKTEKFDVITSRAVASLDKISALALPLLKKGGYFVAYKSKKAESEIDEAQKTLKKFNAKVIDIINYKLTSNEDYTRNLIVILNC